MIMIDYDVMVFVRHTDRFDPVDEWGDFIYRTKLKSIVVIPFSQYIRVRDLLIRNEKQFISEIQLIKPRTANITYNGTNYKGRVLA